MTNIDEAIELGRKIERHHQAVLKIERNLKGILKTVAGLKLTIQELQSQTAPSKSNVGDK